MQIEKNEKLMEKCASSKDAKLQCGVLWEYRAILLPILAGILIRLSLSWFNAQSFDVSFWYWSANGAVSNLGPYSNRFYSYPPLWFYTFAPIFKLLAPVFDPSNYGAYSAIPFSFAVSPWVGSPQFLMLVKLPLILADLATGLLIYRIALDAIGDAKRAKIAFCIWFLNPLVIFISSVHGMYDILPAMLTVFAFWMMYKGRPAISGAAIALSVLYKIYAVFLIPAYIGYALAAMPKEKEGNAKRGIWNAAKFIMGGLVPAALFILPNLLIDGDFVRVFQSRAVGINVGGFNPWLVVYLGPVGNAIFNWVTHHPNIFYSMPAFISALFSISFGFLTYFAAKKGGSRFSVLLASNIMMVVVILLSLLVTNPQYIIWLLPFAVIGTFFYGWDRRVLFAVSAAGIAFDLIVAKMYYPYPLIHLLGIDSAAFNSAVSDMFFWNGVPHPVFSVLQTASAIVGFLAFLRYFIMSFRANPEVPAIISRIFHRNGRARKIHAARVFIPDSAGKASGRPVFSAAFVIIFAAFLFASQSYIMSSHGSMGKTGDSFGVDSSLLLEGNDTAGGKSSFAANCTVSAGLYDSSMLITAVPLPECASNGERRILVYYDDGHIYNGPVFIGRWIGLIDHLNPEVGFRDDAIKIDEADASGLGAAFLTQNASEASQTTIVIPSGSFPIDIFPKYASEIRAWMESGGRLVWIGGPLGYWVSSGNGIVPIYDFGNISGQELILGYNISDSNPEAAMPMALEQTPVSAALGIRYPGTYYGAIIEAVEAHGGKILGNIMRDVPMKNGRIENLTSVAYVPVGCGGLLYFGGNMDEATTMIGEDSVARDFAMIYLSRIMESSGDFFASRILEVSKGGSAQARIELGFTQENTSRICISAFNKEDYSYFFDSKTVLLDDLR